MRRARAARRVLVDRMRVFVETWGRVPPLFEFVFSGTASLTVYRYFGSYNRLVEAAGFVPNKPFGKRSGVANPEAMRLD